MLQVVVLIVLMFEARPIVGHRLTLRTSRLVRFNQFMTEQVVQSTGSTRVHRKDKSYTITITCFFFS